MIGSFLISSHLSADKNYQFEKFFQLVSYGLTLHRNQKNSSNKLNSKNHGTYYQFTSTRVQSSSFSEW